MSRFIKWLVMPAVMLAASLMAAPQAAEAQGFGVSIYSGSPYGGGYYGSPYGGGYSSYRSYSSYGAFYGNPYTFRNSYYGGYGGGYPGYRSYYGSGYGGGYGHHHHHHCR